MELLNNSIEHNLKTLYNLVFDENGEVKPCGRTNCINLIQFIDGITHTSGIYGNKDTGEMNIDAIKEFVKTRL